MKRCQQERYSGRSFSKSEILEIKEIIATCCRLSRTELANTICELLEWKRPTGRLKTVECRQFLEYLEKQGYFKLPERKAGRPVGSKTHVGRSKRAGFGEPISGEASQYRPLKLVRVESKEQRNLWYEYIDRYHYLGYQLPYGAQIRYFIESEKLPGEFLGCMQFSSPAWKMSARDRWIGWNEVQRKENLQKIINQSRFLIFPWVKVKNLASAALAVAIRAVPEDWQNIYGYRPVLLETLVDAGRYAGTCYKAANWICAGETTGRGRMDRENKLKGKAPKQIYLYPLTKKFRPQLQAQQEGIWD